MLESIFLNCLNHAASQGKSIRQAVQTIASTQPLRLVKGVWRWLSQRIGEFPKELEMTEGRSTGIPKILKEMAATTGKSNACYGCPQWSLVVQPPSVHEQSADRNFMSR